MIIVRKFEKQLIELIMEVSLIFPNHIYEFNPCVKTHRKIVMIEDNLFFTGADFHKQKLVLHRATMKFYEKYLTKYGFDVEYIEFADYQTLEDIFKVFSQRGIKTIHHVETVDYRLEIQMIKLCRDYGFTRKLYDTPNFFIRHEDIDSFFENGKYDLQEFYIKHRKKLNILIENDKPVGGKWNFDTEKKKRIPENVELPKIKFPEKNKYVYEAIDYVNKHFPNNPGNAQDFNYPVTFQAAIEFLDDFLKNRIANFAIYQDAIAKEDSYLFHSIMSPIMNCGILSPGYVVNQALEFNADYDYSISSLEGFIRQIIGWREYIRAVYILEGNRQRVSNHWNSNRDIPKGFSDGTTGIEPIDAIIKKILKSAWCNHIERIMILGNFMQLCEVNPNKVYDWFMSMFVDSYEWALVPNVYGMSQYADGGLISIKPYISDSKYIIERSNFGQGQWCEIWDGLYRRFVMKHRNELAQNPKMKQSVNQIETMDKKVLADSIELAEAFLSKL